jgi:hypothetical protein
MKNTLRFSGLLPIIILYIAGTENMKRIVRIVLFIGTLVLIAGLVGFIALKIGEFRLAGEQSASAEYTILRNAVAPITSEQEFGDQFVRDRLKSLYGASAHLLAVQVLDRNGLVLWKMPDDSPYFASPATSPGSVFSAPGISTVIYMTPLPEGMKLMALYSILSQRDIANTLLVPIIALAAWIVLLVVLQFVLKEKPAEGAEAAPAPAEAPSGEEPQEIAETIEEETLEEEEEKLEEATGQNIEEGAPEAAGMEATELDEEMEEILQDQEVPFEEKPPVTASATETPPQPEPALDVEMLAHTQKVVQEEPGAQPPSQSVPEEDFEKAQFVAPPEKPEQISEPTTFPSNLSLDALRRTLETELQRNQETSLLLIQCILAGASDPSALALGVTIRDYFASASLVFELAKGCYAAVLPGTDAGSSLKLAVDLDDVLTTTASLYKDIAEEPPFYFGISALYARTIPPERLYKEALAALHKARESGSRILAFKPASAAA